jgi:lysophospholipase L1-like esterase
MKTYMFAVILSTLVIPQAILAQKNNEVLFEHIEWTNIWIPSANKADLPRVLLIGNSITQGYYPMVESGLSGKAFVARYTTSRGIIDPVLLSEIKNLIKQHKYSVIHFNNGLHGIEYDAVQYEKGMVKLIRLLKKHGQGAVLIGATSTPVLPGFAHWKSDEFNHDLITSRNRIMVKVCRENNIDVNDLYPVTHSRPELFSDDKIHYTKEGYKILGEQVVKNIFNKL